MYLIWESGEGHYESTITTLSLPPSLLKSLKITDFTTKWLRGMHPGLLSGVTTLGMGHFTGLLLIITEFNNGERLHMGTYYHTGYFFFFFWWGGGGVDPRHRSYKYRDNGLPSSFLLYMLCGYNAVRALYSFFWVFGAARGF